MNEPNLSVNALMDGALFQALIVLVQELHRRKAIDAREYAAALESSVAFAQGAFGKSGPEIDLKKAIAKNMRDVAEALARAG